MKSNASSHQEKILWLYGSLHTAVITTLPSYVATHKRLIVFQYNIHGAVLQFLDCQAVFVFRLCLCHWFLGHNMTFILLDISKT